MIFGIDSPEEVAAIIAAVWFVFLMAGY